MCTSLKTSSFRRIGCLCFLVLLVLSVCSFALLPTSVQFHSKPPTWGCYKYNALIVYAECTGDGLLSVIGETFLNLWAYLTVYQPFAVAALLEGRNPASALGVLLSGIIGWALLLLLLLDSASAKRRLRDKERLKDQ